MTLQRMIELVQQHHPHMGETEAKLLLNQAKDSFCEDTETVKTQGSFTTETDKMLYDIGLAADGSILKILNIWIGDSGSEIKAPRLQGTLNIKDSV